ncbi:MAG: GNAT family N-acetyltransferase [Chitinivibrionales bacterium]|nr:GNAT family N-acetyltransferase [Chitinivibrionales bacterium]MBD3396277.1 GNAT family N-acetyltransferase [Chitinivibrionales bacterium]
MRRLAKDALCLAQKLPCYPAAASLFAREIDVEEAELADLVRHRKWFFPCYAGRILRADPRVRYLMVRRRNTIAGSVGLLQKVANDNSLDICWISALRVRTIYRRMGIGRQLMHAAIDKARRGGCRELRLSVGLWRTPAIKLYRTLGFVIVPEHARKWPHKRATLRPEMEMKLLLA